MPRNKRDDFSRSTIERLAKRAGNRCSFPGCNAITIGPSAVPRFLIPKNTGKSTLTGNYFEKWWRIGTRFLPDPFFKNKIRVNLRSSAAKNIHREGRRVRREVVAQIT
jgi:hypothetical protein